MGFCPDLDGLESPCRILYSLSQPVLSSFVQKEGWFANVGMWVDRSLGHDSCPYTWCMTHGGLLTPMSFSSSAKSDKKQKQKQNLPDLVEIAIGIKVMVYKMYRLTWISPMVLVKLLSTFIKPWQTFHSWTSPTIKLRHFPAHVLVSVLKSNHITGKITVTNWTIADHNCYIKA